MVHQLSLHSTIPHTSFAQTVTTLQALTGLISPEPIATYTLTTKPHNVFKPKFEPGKVNQIEQYYMECITTWPCEDISLSDVAKPILKGDNITVDKLFTDGTDRTWTLQISDIPIAGKNQVCSAQTIFESTLVHHHTNINIVTDDAHLNESKMEDVEEIKIEDIDIDIKENADKDTKHESSISQTKKSKDSFLQFLEDLGYDVINQFWIKGIRFFYGDVIIEMYKVFIRNDDEAKSSDSANESIRLKLLDESNTFQIKAYTNIPKSTDVELKDQGTRELLKLKEILKNSIKFEIPDRIYMDSRVNNE
ncbi:uncharacterized protein PRCAT00005909001 [Priceomyces carsonii]|uniref:uncharacterized protein n=1 Tax=Priceomyces carsonii TaxID=28549 RepID=UPI002ED8EBF8|nr:unnamed protein product [Priceomyces carsonii]